MHVQLRESTAGISHKLPIRRLLLFEVPDQLIRRGTTRTTDAAIGGRICDMDNVSREVIVVGGVVFCGAGAWGIGQSG